MIIVTENFFQSCPDRAQFYLCLAYYNSPPESYQWHHLLINTVEPGYNEQKAPYYYIDIRLDIIHMIMESAPNRHWPDSLL